MTVTNYPKLIVAVTAMVCVTVLAALSKIAPEAATTIITAVLAYILGNGVAAVGGKSVQPVIGRRPDSDPTPVEEAPTP